MSEAGEPTPTEILAAIQAQGRAIAALTGKVTQVEADVSAMRNEQAELRGNTSARLDTLQRTAERDTGLIRDDIRQARADIAGVKADTAIAEQYNADTHEALVRHIADPNAHRGSAA